MDPLFKAYGTERYRNRDQAIRYVEERDIPAIAELFRANYGDAYIADDVYDGRWVKRSLHSDQIICLVLEEEGKVLATGSIVLNLGDYNDKSGEIGRIVVHPDCAGRGLGKRLIEGLFQAAANSIEFALGEARTAHEITQKLFEQGNFSLIGFAPQLLNIKGSRESLVLYAALHDNGHFLRSAKHPSLIRQAAPLAECVLTEMGLRSELAVIDGPFSQDDPARYEARPLDRSAVGRLLRIPNGRIIDPLLFGNVSIEQGFTAIRDKSKYLVAYDDANKPVGTIGFQYDETSQLLKGIELISENDTIWPSLLRALVEAGDQLCAEVMTVDVSAYQPRLQRLFFDHGFRPAAYAPAMVFHGTERLDLVKMIRLNVPYDPGEMSLTEKAKKMVALVGVAFK